MHVADIRRAPQLPPSAHVEPHQHMAEINLIARIRQARLGQLPRLGILAETNQIDSQRRRNRILADTRGWPGGRRPRNGAGGSVTATAAGGRASAWTPAKATPPGLLAIREQIQRNTSAFVRLGERKASPALWRRKGSPPLRKNGDFRGGGRGRRGWRAH